MPNLIHLFTTARVLRATYRIVTTSLLLYYIGKRVTTGQKTVYERKLPGRGHY